MPEQEALVKQIVCERRARIWSTVLDAVGAALIVAGIALWAVPLAVIVAGVAVILIAHPITVRRRQ